MVKKRLSFNTEARSALVRGVNTLAQAVTITLGPRGRNVGIGRKWNEPRVVHDGVSVAKEIDVDDPFEQMGIEMAREAAIKTNDVAGDGTTTSILLTDYLATNGNTLVDQVNPMVLQRELQNACKEVVDVLKTMARPVEDMEAIKQVATLSAADEEVGELIAEAMNKVGKRGVITVESGRGIATSIEYKEGMEFDRGWVSPGFITDEERMEAEVRDPFILITPERITTNSQILPFLNKIGEHMKGSVFSVVVIADKIDYEALATLLVNHERGIISAIAIEAPGFGDDRADLLEDIAALTGGKVFSTQKGMSFDTFDDITIFGRADKVWANRETTKIIGGKGDKDAVAIRVKQVENRIAKEKSDYNREKLEERIARMAGSVAIINVGATTKTELHDRVERVKDAVAATRAAVDEGILPGGGTAVLRARRVFENKKEKLNHGEELLVNALAQPITKLYSNAGFGSDEVDATIAHANEGDYTDISNPIGIDVTTGEEGNMFDLGVIEPMKVVRSSIQNAVSVAGTIVTTEALVAVVDDGK